VPAYTVSKFFGSAKSLNSYELAILRYPGSNPGHGVQNFRISQFMHKNALHFWHAKKASLF
jgi:hypothetical protein